MSQVTRWPIWVGSLGRVIAAKLTLHRRGSTLVAFAAATALIALSGASAAVAAPPLAKEPNQLRNHAPLRTGTHVGLIAHAGDTGGAEPGTTPPGTIPGTIRADLQLGAAVPDRMLLAWLKSASPQPTDEVLRLIPAATAASSTLPALRANVIRIAIDFLNNPTLEDKGSANRSKIICALGGKQACAERWAWCAIFASSVWRMAGVRAMTLTPPVGGLVQWGIAHKRWHDVTTTAGKSYIPAAGDIVAYGCNAKRTYCDHTGIVSSATKNVINTIEGNTSTSYGRDGVATKLRSRDSWVTGFISLG